MTARWSLMREVEGEGQKDFFLSLGGSSKNWDRLLKVEGQSGDLELLFWKLGRKFRGISVERNLHPPHPTASPLNPSKRNFNQIQVIYVDFLSHCAT